MIIAAVVNVIVVVVVSGVVGVRGGGVGPSAVRCSLGTSSPN